MAYDLGDDGGQWLKADVHVRLGTDAYDRVQAWAIAAVVLYPIGVLVGTAALLLRARRAILMPHASTPLSRALAFIYREYTPSCYLWEVMEIARRFVLVGLLQVIAAGTMLQLVLGTLTCIAYLTLQLQASPYKDPADGYVALASSMSLAVFFLLCIVYKVRH